MKNVNRYANAWLTEEQSNTNSLSIPLSSKRSIPTITSAGEYPNLISGAGPAAGFACEKFIYAKIRNPHTRAAYEHAIRKFLSRCERLGKNLPHISPRDVGAYLDSLNYAHDTTL